MKKLICLLLTLTMLISLSTALAVNAGTDFSDLPTGWSHDAVQAAVDNGLLKGSGGKINPRGALTRAEMAAILVRAMGGTAKGDVSAYTDVSTDAWYYNELSVAVGMKLIRGSGALMRPNAPISRQEAGVILSRLLCLKDGSSDLSTYADGGKVSSWAKGAMSALVGAGYMKGDGRNLNPGASITREEFAQLMYNMISSYRPAPGTYTENFSGNVVLKADGTTLDGVTVSGDVIVGDGVGNGTVTLKNCSISGRIVARGGGANSIIIVNTTAKQVVVARPDGALHVKTEQSDTKTDLVVYDGKEQVVVDGDYKDITVQADVPVIIASGTAQSAVVAGDGATLTVAASATVQSTTITSDNSTVVVKGAVTDVAVAEETQNSKVIVEDTGTADTVVVKGDNATVTVAPQATVKSAEVTGSDNTVVIKGTVDTVDVGEGSANTKVEVAETGKAKSVVVDGAGASVEGTGTVETVTVGEKATEAAVSTPKTDITNNSSDIVTTNNGDLPSGGTGTTDTKGGLNEGGSSESGGDTPAPTSYYKLTLSITNGGTNPIVVTGATDSAYLTGSTPFFYQAATLIQSKQRQLSEYRDPAAKAIMDDGLEKYKNQSSWTSFLSTNSSYIHFSSPADQTLFSDCGVTFAQIEGIRTVQYSNGGNHYTLTIQIAKI